MQWYVGITKDVAKLSTDKDNLSCECIKIIAIRDIFDLQATLIDHADKMFEIDTDEGHAIFGCVCCKHQEI